MKRQHLLTVLATLVLLVCCILTTNADAATYGYYTYTVSGGQATITDCDTAISGEITIPSTLGGYPVTGIGNSAFSNCSSLTSITIPDSIASIGRRAFESCGKLTTIILPNSITHISDKMFHGCSNLTSITIPDSIISIGNEVFRYCSSLASITIPDSVVSIGSNTFDTCRNLKSVTLSKNITTISWWMFYGCWNLTDITIPDGITSIEDSAFENCRNLASITIPDSVTKISGSPFSGCTNLNYNIYDNAKYLGNSKNPYLALVDTVSEDITSCIINEKTKFIVGEAFYHCGNLSNVTIGENVTSIGHYAFAYCSSLASIGIGDGITNIESAAFLRCSSLNHVAYLGTQTQWANVTKDANDVDFINASHFHFETAFEHVDTCAQTGIYCPICQILISGTVWTVSNPNPKAPHQIAAATCTTPKHCTVCGATEGEVLGHSGQWFELVPAACVTDGINARICDACGETEVETIAAPGHSYSAVVTAPTCTEKGYTTKTCATCGDVTVTDYVDATGHDYSTVVVQPTCTEQGYTTKTCATCGDVTTEYTPAKGHGWSAWIQISAASCKAEGSKMRFCTCGVRETETIAKLPHSCENYICTVCGELDYANTVLTGDTQVNWNLKQDLHIDLNGFDLSGTIITNGFKVYGMDSTTDSYSCENIGYFTCVDENGDFVVPERFCTEGEKQYMAICVEDRYSFHCFWLGVTHMTLDPEVTGVGYKAAIFGDEMVLSQLDEKQAFSFCLQLEDYRPVYRHIARDALVSGESNTLRLRNYDVENYGEANLWVNVGITLKDGTRFDTERAAMTLRDLVEYVNENYTAYSDPQLAQFKAMLEKYEIVKKWDISNLI